jgi:transcription elongation factor GreA
VAGWDLHPLESAAFPRHTPEADAKSGTISITSPLARALIGNRKGASVEVAAPGGTKAYKIQKVEWR